MKFIKPIHIAITAIILLCAGNPLSGQQKVNSSLLWEKNNAKISFHFHECINSYRKEKKLPALVWNDTLAWAASNHTRWMVANDELTHQETKKDKYFTGNSISDRINFSMKTDQYLYCGENCLYFFANIKENEELSDQKAHDLALDAFEQWRASAGHNKNMLHKYKQHGVFFYYYDGQLWATDVFCDEVNLK